MTRLTLLLLAVALGLAAYGLAGASRTAVAPQTAPAGYLTARDASARLLGPISHDARTEEAGAFRAAVTDVRYPLPRPTSYGADGLLRHSRPAAAKETPPASPSVRANLSGAPDAPSFLAAESVPSGASPLSCSSPCHVDVAYPDSGHVSNILQVVRTGKASTYGPRFSEWWVALPDGPGWRFTVCGPGGCRTLVSTDQGPDQRIFPDRIVDLPVGAFEAVCGVRWTMGLCPVSVTLLGRVR